MDILRTMKVDKTKRGTPLYIAVRDALREAIETGVFSPGRQMPSTKQLSEQLEVSLVTAHRALQELVGSGVLQRAQGRGTFVHEQFRDRIRILNETRIGLIINPDTSLADYHYCQLAEGIRRQAVESAADVVLLRFSEDIRNECDGFLLVSPQAEHLEHFLSKHPQKPAVLLDAGIGSHTVHTVQVDNGDIARKAVDHLSALGHQSIGYIGGDDHIPNAAELWEGFRHACQQKGIAVQQSQVIRSLSWRLDEREQMALARLLRSTEHPTAIFAAGYNFAMDVYRAAAAAKMSVPDQLSVVGVDDAPSAAHLAPPLTTVRQPLLELGKAAINLLIQLVKTPISSPQHQAFPAQLIVRKSTAALLS